MLGDKYRQDDSADELLLYKDALRKLVEALKKCEDHLDGCSHGVPDDLRDSVTDAIAEAERLLGDYK